MQADGNLGLYFLKTTLTNGIQKKGFTHFCPRVPENDYRRPIVFCGFVICGFDYPQIVNCIQNLLSVDISLGYSRILPFFNRNMNNKMQKQLSLLIFGLGIQGIF
jgi:hypothetical protein